LFNYTIETMVINEDELTEEDFLLGVVWEELPDGNEHVQQVIIDRSYFGEELTSEEIEILAILMMVGWVQR